jgi:hypothetical protein
MFNNILLPTDGSQLAETAASHGRMLAAASEATVHILAVISDQPINEQLAQEQAEDAVSSVETNVEQESTVEHESVIERGSGRGNRGDELWTPDLHENFLDVLDGVWVIDDSSVDILEDSLNGLGEIVSEKEPGLDAPTVRFEGICEFSQRVRRLFVLFARLLGKCLLGNFMIPQEDNRSRREKLHQRV